MENTSAVHVIIPVKRLDKSKSRLSKILSEELRVKLTLQMFWDVLNSVRRVRDVRKVLVVTPDVEVSSFTGKLGCMVLLEKSEGGVNKAVSYAIDCFLKERVSRVLVLPSDIPLIQPKDIRMVMEMSGNMPSVVISPSMRFDGTNLLFLNPSTVIPTRYEEDSFHSHLVEAYKRRLKVGIYLSKNVMLDVDTPDDLAEFLKIESDTYSYRFLRECLAPKLRV